MTKSTTSLREAGSRLLAEITCPNCWHRFPPEQLLFIARHDRLIGDPIVGAGAYRRFLPSRFNLVGDALDAHGMACQQIACPRCHLEISRPLIEMAPFFNSIVGAAASGKSYLLAAMIWEMRSRAPRFGFTLADGDPTANYELQRYEELLFMNPDPETPVALRKTEMQGSELYQSIVLEGQPQTFPRPFQFTLSPAVEGAADFPHRALVLYDNAGEQFQPGQDSTGTPVTLHLAESAGIFFVFDPVQDPRFRRRCRGDDPQIVHNLQGVSRQEIILNEMAARVRRYKGLAQTSRHRRPLVLILAKADMWLDEPWFEQEPVTPGSSPGSSPGNSPASSGSLSRLDLGVVERASDFCRGLLLETCPEIVSAAESFSERVVYIPVSSLGTSPERFLSSGMNLLGVRPARIKPRWVTVPMLWSLAQGVPGLIETV